MNRHINKNKADVLLGLQWGDEGKGKSADAAKNYDVVARFQGGPNAGHSLEFEGIKFVAHTCPSGIFLPNVINIIGDGVVLDPVGFENEINGIVATKKLTFKKIQKKLFIGKKATFILPIHRWLDIAEDATKLVPIGTTAKGIGPALRDKLDRNALFMKDVFAPDFLDKVKAITEKHLLYIKNVLGYDISKATVKDKEKNTEYTFEQYTQLWIESLEVLCKMSFIDCRNYIQKALKAGKKILAEGAQGSLLDITFGTYPFVTCSDTVSLGVCKGLGINPHQVGKILGIMKAYTTRVGNGPFPTELTDENGEHLGTFGREWGASTGRKRKCGWLDLALVKYTIGLNGEKDQTEITLAKLDILSGLKQLKICVAYKDKNGKIVRDADFNESFISDDYTPVYKEFDTWTEDITGIRCFDDLPIQAKIYVRFIERFLGVKITLIGNGPDREQFIMRTA